jgi:hypothetical protein
MLRQNPSGTLLAIDNRGHSMSALHDRYTAEGHDARYPLILSQRTSAPDQNTPLLFQEFCLGLSDDQSRIVLRRYFEQYGPATRNGWSTCIRFRPPTSSSGS